VRYVLVFLVTICVCVVGFIYQESRKEEKAWHEKYDIVFNPTCPPNVIEWLEGQKKGDNDTWCWSKEIDRERIPTFFALESYEVVKMLPHIEGERRWVHWVTVRVHASNRGGSPIVYLCELELNEKGEITSLRTLQ